LIAEQRSARAADQAEPDAEQNLFEATRFRSAPDRWSRLDGQPEARVAEELVQEIRSLELACFFAPEQESVRASLAAARIKAKLPQKTQSK